MPNYTEVAGTIRKYMAINSVKNIKALAKPVGMTESKLYKRMKDVKTFRISELDRIYGYLRVPEGERLKM